jgi:hypothetical protein
MRERFVEIHRHRSPKVFFSKQDEEQEAVVLAVKISRILAKITNEMRVGGYWRNQFSKKITMLRKRTEKVVITVVYKESKSREAD